MKFSEVLKKNKCRPFTYEIGSASSGSRIGGRPPQNAIPMFYVACQKYFSTIEFDAGLSVSIFYSFDIYGDNEIRDIISHNNRPLFSSELIDAVVHERGVASEDSNISAEVSCHKIKFGIEQRDMAQGDSTVPYPQSKIGGKPFVDNVSLVGEAFERLLTAGFQQLIQFDTPNPNTHPFVDGFPWDPGWLHVFVKGMTIEGCDFAFVIQQETFTAFMPAVSSES